MNIIYFFKLIIILYFLFLRFRVRCEKYFFLVDDFGMDEGIKNKGWEIVLGNYSDLEVFLCVFLLVVVFVSNELFMFR